MPKKLKKVTGSPEPSERVVIHLDKTTAEKLDREVEAIKERNPGTKPTRASVAKYVVSQQMIRNTLTDKEKRDAFDALRREANVLKDRANESMTEGDPDTAKKLLLFAAARELESLACLGSTSERVIMTALIDLVATVKSATGYKALPDVPATKKIHRQHAS